MVCVKVQSRGAETDQSVPATLRSRIYAALGGGPRRIGQARCASRYVTHGEEQSSMRELVVLTFTTLDSVMQAPGGPDEGTSDGFEHRGWMVGYGDDALADAMGESMTPPFDLVLGHQTYEIMARHWPDTDEPGADLMNSATKHVASTTLMELDWQTIRQHRVRVCFARSISTSARASVPSTAVSRLRDAVGSIQWQVRRRAVRAAAWPDPGRRCITGVRGGARRVHRELRRVRAPRASGPLRPAALRIRPAGVRARPRGRSGGPGA